MMPEPGYEAQTIDMERFSPQMLDFLRRQGVPVPVSGGSES